jgi:hypothetical protein
VRVLGFALPLLLFATTPSAQDTSSQDLDVRLMPGIGVAGLVAPDLAGGFSAGLSLQISRFLLIGEGLGAAGSGLLTLFAGGAGGLFIGDAQNVPYALVGAGFLAGGNSDNRSHNAVVLSAEFGAAFLRSPQRREQIWLGARVFLPLFDTQTSGSSVYGGVPGLPVLSINLRLWI